MERSLSYMGVLTNIFIINNGEGIVREVLQSEQKHFTFLLFKI